jgi:hypothetical protein
MRFSLLGVVAMFMTFSAVPAGGSADAENHPVIGSGEGVDHGTLLTRSLVRTSRVFADLGFTVSPIGSYDNGFENSTVWFGDGTYLELFGVHDAQAVSEGPESHAVSGPEGLTWVTIECGSIEDTVKHLKQRGHALFGPETLPSPETWSYKLAGLEGDTLPGQRIYFIEYNHDRINAGRQSKLESWQAKETHRNTAQALAAVWIAVRSLEDAEASFRESGFTLGERVDLPHLKGVGRRIATKDREILLVQPAADSDAMQSLGSRSSAFIGYSVRVKSLATAQAVLAEGKLDSLPVYVGPHGRSVLIPPDHAGGSWLEFFE